MPSRSVSRNRCIDPGQAPGISATARPLSLSRLKVAAMVSHSAAKSSMTRRAASSESARASHRQRAAWFNRLASFTSLIPAFCKPIVRTTHNSAQRGRTGQRDGHGALSSSLNCRARKACGEFGGNNIRRQSDAMRRSIQRPEQIMRDSGGRSEYIRLNGPSASFIDRNYTAAISRVALMGSFSTLHSADRFASRGLT
jgi:hypothetical protein